MLPFPLGFAIEQKGYTYRPLHLVPHVTASGEATTLVAWEGVCAACGGSFVTYSPLRLSKALNRRCGPCREGACF